MKPRPLRVRRRRGHRRPVSCLVRGCPARAALPLAVATLAPVALFTWRAMRAPINFDGGMNLQVAERLAQGDGYTRFCQTGLVTRISGST